MKCLAVAELRQAFLNSNLTHQSASNQKKICRMGKGTMLAIEARPEAREPLFLALARTIIEEIERGRLMLGAFAHMAM